MAIIFSSYLKYFSFVILIFTALYKYEISPDQSSSSDKGTLLLTKKATLQYNRSYLYKIITNINKYTLWYPNIADVQSIRSDSSQNQGKKYRLITKLPIIGNISSILHIHKIDRPKQFVYSINSWLLEINSIELKDNNKNLNSTHIEWTVYTKRHSILFQYILFPFAKFYKTQLVREALLLLKIQNHRL